jgi:iron complex outermembrane receptor protein
MSLSPFFERSLRAGRSLRARPQALALAAFALLGASALQAQTQMAPVMVNGTRFSQDALTLPFGVSVINAEDIARSGAVTINQAVSKLLGVQTRQDLSGGADDALDLRGFGVTSGSNQIVIVDGLRLDEGDTSGARLAGIAIDTVERIEVLRGSGTVLYGEGGTGGVIIITTRSGAGPGRNVQGQVYGSAGSLGTRELRANVALTQGEFSLDVAANQRQSNNYRDNARSDVKGESIAGQWRRDDLRLVLRHSRDELDAGLPGSLSSAQYSANPKQASTPDDHGNIRSSRSSVLAEARLGEVELAFDAGVRDKALRSIYGGYPYDYDVNASNQALRARYQSVIGGLQNSLITGLDASKWKRATAFGSAEQTSRALYARDELTLASGTRLSAGVRRESIAKTNSDAQGLNGHQNAWELGVVQPLSAAFSAFARVGNSYRLANADEYSFTSPNAVLQAQTSRDTELGLRWRVDASKVELRVYRNQLKNEIGYDPNAIGPFGAGANINFEPTRHQGAELELSHALSKTLQLRGNLAWRDARFQSGAYADKQVPLTARRTASVGADWQIAERHRLGANLFYASVRHPDFENSCRMSPYATLDLRYAYQVGTTELSLGVINATDHRYFTQAFSCQAGVTESIYPEAGRVVNAALRWRF